MELKESRELAELIRQQPALAKGLRVYTAIITLDNRITELEAQRDELLEACKDALDICLFTEGDIVKSAILTSRTASLMKNQFESAIARAIKQPALTRDEKILS